MLCVPSLCVSSVASGAGVCMLRLRVLLMSTDVGVATVLLGTQLLLL